jgi:glycerophosphoryl diester phosphodiesterase
MGVAVKVFGHRGACGYLPENTMESFELAFQQGADAIEFDVVLTSDSVPVILHDDDLTKTTTIDPSAERTKVHELSATELDQLRAKERYPHRTQSAQFDGQFKIPTLSQVLNHPGFDGKWLIVELKYGKQLAALGLDLVAAVAKELAAANWQSRGIRITIESFDFGILRQLKAVVPEPEYVFLSAQETLPEGFSSLNDELLEEIAENFDGVSVSLEMLMANDLVARAKRLGLTVFGYTARVETAKPDVETWFAELISSGADGIFADQPDRLLALVRAGA